MKNSIRAALVASAFCVGACSGTNDNNSHVTTSSGGKSSSARATGGVNSALGGSSAAGSGGLRGSGGASGGGGAVGGATSDGTDHSSTGGTSGAGGISSGDQGGNNGSGGEGDTGGSGDNGTGGSTRGAGGSTGAGGSMSAAGGTTSAKGGSTGAAAGAGGSSAVADAGTASGTLPCNIQTLLATRCDSCHGAMPSGGAPSSLVTYADLTRADLANPSMTEAQAALARMQSTTSPMPPTPAAAATASEIAALQAWISAGYPSGSCGGDAGPPPAPDPLNASPTCTSKQTWNGGGDNGSSLMEPGQACIACHSRGEGPRFTIAGTLYPTGHEPNNCYGVNGGGMKVVVTDSAGATVTLTPNAAGNFYSTANLKTPLHAKVVNGSSIERVMAAAMTTGDCNSCHTQSGANGAPGRITVPM